MLKWKGKPQKYIKQGDSLFFMVKTKNLYSLPFHKNVKTKAESDKSVFSHRGHMRHSLDFPMKTGTRILAAADGLSLITFI